MDVVSEERAEGETNLDPKIRMQQHLELKRLVALIPHVQHRLQTIRAQGDGIDQPEVVAPSLAGLGRQLGGEEAEVELDAVVAGAAFGDGPGLGGRLAEEFPVRAAGEAVLREGRGCVV